MADFTIANVIGDARIELGDTYEGAFAYPTSDLAQYAGEALVELRSIRPSTRYHKDTVQLQEDDDRWAALTTEDVELILPVPARYRRSLVAYVVFKCMRRDDTDRGNRERAEIAYKRFVETASM